MLSVLCCGYQREWCALRMAATRALAKEYVYPFSLTLLTQWNGMKVVGTIMETLEHHDFLQPAI